ncbi:MAG TPA: non-canonical purine NTP pyrophosphatase [Candidatus Binataceae bacterium]
MKPILIATTNPAKLEEYRILLRDFSLEPVSLRQAAISDAPEETGNTFRENALIKARFYFACANIPTLADDGGLEIDALGGEPGVRSHRWLSEAENTDRALADEVIRRMEGVEQRTARLHVALALIYRSHGELRERAAEAAIEGVIAPRAYPSIRPGFPYRAVLWLPGRRCYLGELGDEEEARISQRRTAIAELGSELARIAAGG